MKPYRQIRPWKHRIRSCSCHDHRANRNRPRSGTATCSISMPRSIDRSIDDDAVLIVTQQVAGLVEVLVGKTIDQALMDVVEERERDLVAAQLDQFDHMRRVKLAEMQRLEAREARLHDERQR